MAWAQAGKTELFGSVEDSSGLVVAGVRIEVSEERTGIRFQSVSSGRGEFHFFGLPSGQYHITAEKEGFRKYVRAGVRLQTAERVPLTIRLEVGDVRESIEVSADRPLLQASAAEVSHNVEQKKLAALPLNGRTFLPLVALSPGVALPPGSAFPRISGSRPRTSEYLYDGISVLQPEPGQIAFNPVIDAIEEFRVHLNSYSAEYGRSNGGIIEVSQKSGTNEFHGTLFEFFRNQELNARNLFASSEAKPVFRRNQFGMVFGGPVRKNRSFFFADYQGTRFASGVVRISTVPTTLQRQGVFTEAIGGALPQIYDPATTRPAGGRFERDPFSNNTIPAERLDPAALTVLRRYPLPNLFSVGRELTANNFRRAGTENQDQDQFDLRLDHYFGDHHRILGRYSYLRDHSEPLPPLPDGSGDISAGVIGNTATRADSLVLEHGWTRSAQSVNQLRFGYTRRGLERDALRIGGPAAQTIGINGIPDNAFSDAVPVVRPAGYQQIGPPSSANADFGTSVTQFLDTYSTLRRGHSLKFGADIRHESLDILQPPNPTGRFDFNSLATAQPGLPSSGNSIASLALGQVNAFTIDIQKEKLRPRANVAEFFIQDDWKASSRATFNLGVRYTLNFPSTEERDRGAIFNLQTQKLDYFGRDGFPRTARNLEKTNSGPRLGAAYRLKDSSVIRAGYGLVWIEQAGITTPFTTPFFPFVQTVAQSSLDNLNPAFVLSSGPSVEVLPPVSDAGLGQGVFAVDRRNGSGYAQQWNFTVQHTFASDFSLEAGYLGSKLTRLGVPDSNLNQLTAAQLALGRVLLEPVFNPFFGQIPSASSLGGPMVARAQLLRPFPRFTTVSLYRNNIGHSVYHGLQARLAKRFSHGLTFTAAYTFSKLIDDASAVFDAAILTGPILSFPVADSFNRRLERDLSQGDMTHISSAGFVYELPFGKGLAGGWQLAGVFRAQSGLPVPITQQPNFNSFAGFGIERPNRITDPKLPADQRATAAFFNTAAFRIAPQFTIGNSSRNPVRGPGYTSLDLMIGKTFQIAEKRSAELRIETFNLTNTPPLGTPNGTFGTPGFGSITSAGDPRVFELAAKFHF